MNQIWRTTSPATTTEELYQSSNVLCQWLCMFVWFTWIESETEGTKKKQKKRRKEVTGSTGYKVITMYYAFVSYKAPK